ncbi:hypothetical protein HY994_04345 [Candidatus Micrarchaeota archaeon]|nr:hypothetical protein [Candidatus Micrarchaeota archaeon]
MVRDLTPILSSSHAKVHYEQSGNPLLWNRSTLHEVGKDSATILNSYFPEDLTLDAQLKVFGDKKMTLKTLLRAAMYGPSRHIESAIRRDPVGFMLPLQPRDPLYSAHGLLTEVRQLSSIQEGYAVSKNKLHLLLNTWSGKLTRAGQVFSSWVRGSERIRKSLENSIAYNLELTDAHSIPIRLLAAALDSAELKHLLSAPNEEERFRLCNRIVHFHAPLLRALGLEAQADEIEHPALTVVDKERFRKTLSAAVVVPCRVGGGRPLPS